MNSSFIIGILSIVMGIGTTFMGVGFVFSAPEIGKLYETLRVQMVNPYLFPVLSLILGILNIFLGIKNIKKFCKKRKIDNFLSTVYCNYRSFCFCNKVISRSYLQDHFSD